MASWAGFAGGAGVFGTAFCSSGAFGGDSTDVCADSGVEDTAGGGDDTAGGGDDTAGGGEFAAVASVCAGGAVEPLVDVFADVVAAVAAGTLVTFSLLVATTDVVTFVAFAVTSVVELESSSDAKKLLKSNFPLKCPYPTTATATNTHITHTAHNHREQLLLYFSFFARCRSMYAPDVVSNRSSSLTLDDVDARASSMDRSRSSVFVYLAAVAA
mgnify:CR=1 FL=1